MDTEQYIDTKNGEKPKALERRFYMGYEFLNRGLMGFGIQMGHKELTPIYYFEEACYKDLDKAIEYRDKGYENFINGCQ